MSILSPTTRGSSGAIEATIKNKRNIGIPCSTYEQNQENTSNRSVLPSIRNLSINTLSVSISTKVMIRSTTKLES